MRQRRGLFVFQWFRPPRSVRGIVSVAGGGDGAQIACGPAACGDGAAEGVGLGGGADVACLHKLEAALRSRNRGDHLRAYDGVVDDLVARGGGGAEVVVGPTGV